LVKFEEAVLHGRAVASVAMQLRKKGFAPDIICAHSGWGESLYLKDVYPDVPLLHYCEFYFHAFGGPAHFDPSQPVTLDSLFRIRTRNIVNLLSLESCDWGVCPTRWQHAQHPAEFRDKISVIHDGINTRLCAPASDARVELPSGMTLTRKDDVVTYVARNLETVRGFPTFMRAAAELCRRRANCHVLVVGGDEVSYGPSLPEGQTYRENMLAEVTIDPDRVHFLGKVPYATYIRILQISSAHVYLTVPFVLSWSMLEAMSAGCLVIGSDTPPVTEVIEEGRNGLLVDFFDPVAVVDRVEEVLDHPDRMADMRRRARETVVERYSLTKCLPAQLKLIEDQITGRRPDADRTLMTDRDKLVHSRPMWQTKRYGSDSWVN